MDSEMIVPISFLLFPAQFPILIFLNLCPIPMYFPIVRSPPAKSRLPEFLFQTNQMYFLHFPQQDNSIIKACQLLKFFKARKELLS